MENQFRDTLARVLEIALGFMVAQMLVTGLFEGATVREWLTALGLLVAGSLVIVIIRTYRRRT